MMNLFRKKDISSKTAVPSVHVGVDTSNVATTNDSKPRIDSKSMMQAPAATPERSPQEMYQHEKKLVKSRRLIHKYVKRMGNQADLDLSLDSYGYCYIPFRKFLIILAVPEEEPHHVVLSTMIFDLEEGYKDHTTSRARRQVSRMESHQVQLGRRGSLIRSEGDEVFLFNSLPIRGLRYADMVNRLDDFMETAHNTNTDLAALCR